MESIHLYSFLLSKYAVYENSDATSQKKAFDPILYNDPCHSVLSLVPPWKKGRKEKSGQTVWVYFTTFSIKVSRKAFPPDGKVWLVHKTWLIGLTKFLSSFKSGRLTFFPFSAAFATEKKIRKIIRKQYCISETRED